MTGKRERFAQLVAGQAMTLTAAYVDAGYSSKAIRSALHNSASQLAGSTQIVHRVDEIRAAASKRATVTLTGHLESLAGIRDMALEGDKTATGNTVKNYGAAVQAEGLIGKHSGVAAPDKHQDVTPDVPAEDAITELCTQSGVVHETARAHFMRGLEALKTPYIPDVPEPTQQAPDMVQ